jgi:transposase InsO family protein
MENFFGHLKEEYLRHFKNPSFEQAQQLIEEYIHFYNYERIQLKTKQTPYQCTEPVKVDIEEKAPPVRKSHRRCF